ncbi:MAG: hypothetical protein LBJ08_02295 [Bifidobacteriaceae bacterium]|jgi:arginine exporter protein ArgO|nr:hypothetical protein [Bifidobacteriaceae bacterium]
MLSYYTKASAASVCRGFVCVRRIADALLITLGILGLSVVVERASAALALLGAAHVGVRVPRTGVR